MNKQILFFYTILIICYYVSGINMKQRPYNCVINDVNGDELNTYKNEGAYDFNRKKLGYFYEKKVYSRNDQILATCNDVFKSPPGMVGTVYYKECTATNGKSILINAKGIYDENFNLLGNTKCSESLKASNFQGNAAAVIAFLQ